MRNTKEVNIKIRTYYFFHDMINMKDFFFMTRLILIFKLAKNRQKVIQKHWYLLYWIYHNEKF